MGPVILPGPARGRNPDTGNASTQNLAPERLGGRDRGGFSSALTFSGGGDAVDRGEDGVRLEAALQQAVGQKQAVGVGLRALKSAEPAQRQVHGGKGVLALVPALSGFAKMEFGDTIPIPRRQTGRD